MLGGMPMPDPDANDEVSSPQSPKRVSQQSHAWRWFEYHARQRLTTFRFFLILLVPFGAAYLKALSEGWNGIGVAVCGGGVLVSLAFYFLEVRNEELVEGARTALDRVEEDFSVQPRALDDDREELKQALGWFWRMLGLHRVPRIVKHRFWFRMMFFASAVIFLVAGYFAMLGYTWC